MSKASISLQLLPQTTMKEAYRIVDLVLDLLQEKKDISYVVGPMDTVIEGDLDTLFEIAKEAIQIGHKEGVQPVFSVMKVFSGDAELGCGFLDSVKPAMERHNK